MNKADELTHNYVNDGMGAVLYSILAPNAEKSKAITAVHYVLGK